MSETAAKIGRPEKEYDLVYVQRAASMGCTMEEIATLCGMTRATFYQHMERHPKLKQIVEHGRVEGKFRLRALQWQGCEAGNSAMLIWLGKQLLGQKDNHVISGDPDRPVTYVVHMPAPIDDTQQWLRAHAPDGAFIEGEVIEVGGDET
jgi:hypothetical protein